MCPASTAPTMIDSATPLLPPAQASIQASTPASAQAVLEQLHPLLLPPPPAWTPQTPAWGVLTVLGLMALLWAAWRSGQRWRAARFRRLALAELERLRAELHSSQPAATRVAAARQLPALVRRLALAHAARQEVASLQGPAWCIWLDQSLERNPDHKPALSASAPPQAFTQGVGQHLGAWAYLPPAQLPWDTLPALLDLVEHWIRQHRVPGAAPVRELK